MASGGLYSLIYGRKCPVLEWSARSCDLTIWIPDTHTVRYSDESGVRYSDGYCYDQFSYLWWRWWNSDCDFVSQTPKYFPDAPHTLLDLERFSLPACRNWGRALKIVWRLIFCGTLDIPCCPIEVPLRCIQRKI